MARSFAAEDLVVLPHLNAEGALAVGAQIGTVFKNVAKKQKLPADVLATFKDVMARRQELSDALTSASESGETDPELMRRVDFDMDAACSALAGVLEGWAKVPDPKKTGALSKEAELAADVRARLYPDGLRFINFQYRVEWATVDTLLATIDRQKLGPKLDALGAKKIVDTIRALHRRYGEMLGVTKEKELPPEPESVVSNREAVEQFTRSLKRLVVQVTAYGAGNDKKRADLAARLLAPLAEYESTSTSSAKPAPAPAPAPVPPQNPTKPGA